MTRTGTASRNRHGHSDAGRDERLARHLALLQIILAHRLQHLTGTWRQHGDGIDAVLTVLACLGDEPVVDDRVKAQVDDLVGAIRSVGDGPLALLTERLALSLGEELIVAATWWSEIDAELRSVFGVLHDDGRKRHPSTGVLRTVGRPFGIDVPVQPEHLIQAGVILVDGPLEQPLLTPTCRELLDGRLTGPAGAVRPVAGDRSTPPLPARLAHLIEPLAHLADTARSPVALRGVDGSGRRALAAAVAGRLGRRLVIAETVDPRLELLGRLGLGLPLVTSPDPPSWPAGNGPLLQLAQPEDEPTGSIVVEIPLPAAAERRPLWAAALGDLGLDPEAEPQAELLDRLTDQFQFTETDIEAAARRARLDMELGSALPVGRLLWAAAQRRPDLDLQRVATRIEPAFELDDLILPAGVRDKLDQLVAHQRHRTQVFDRWGFRTRSPRGRGLAALFSGPPGTGKTTAAEAIASELSCDLFRIDLSRVMSKYIGETEQNLAVAFRQAERSGAILLFDEADALFGKRTDVRDAHDRYANLEVSYLLQRVETFTGLVLLSTNKIGNIDEAFQRRLRFIVRFEAPNVEERQRLWRRSIPPEADVDHLDWARLAGHELTGGHIQTAALSAAFMAAADGGPITELHLHRAVADEFEKLNRAAPPIPALEVVP